MVAGDDCLSVFKSNKKVIFGHMNKRYPFIIIY